MKAIENNKLFTEVTSEESATVSGGGPLSYLTYILLATTPASPGFFNGFVSNVTPLEVQDGWNVLINQAPPVNGVVSA